MRIPRSTLRSACTVTFASPDLSAAISFRVAGAITRSRSGPSCFNSAPGVDSVASVVGLPSCSKVTCSADSAPRGVSIEMSTTPRAPMNAGPLNVMTGAG